MSEAQLIHLPIEQLKPGQYQPRRQFDAIALQELADSITAEGVIQPLVGRPLTRGYEIIGGVR